MADIRGCLSRQQETLAPPTSYNLHRERMRTTYRSFADVPAGMQSRIRELHPRDSEEWVATAVPVLGHRSVLEVMNTDGGEEVVLRYLTKVEAFLR
ncbi:MAG TPA: hypothetical protein VF331_03585 [Polyangiales bacterium]